jgi:hypothetical protein
MSTADAPRRPKLELALESLGDTYSRLYAASQAYQQARGLLEQLTASPDAPIEDAGLLLVIGELQLPIPMPTDGQQRLALLDDAVQHLGTSVIGLWRKAHETTTSAVAHCDAAQAAAQQTEPGK